MNKEAESLVNIKRNVENKINKLLNDFVKNTGLPITSVSVDCDTLMGTDKAVAPMFYVELEVKL